ncbi:MAG: 2-oxoacid:acceptor oxidoreductase family protein [Candidatus Heimdallarchaeota archaeon]|nr:2-oxoacid:acceptor oxidoreductase family protein [Candidatus Heimdallarchaeota archaeon]
MVKITDVRLNGRGGQGAVTASRLLGEAAIMEGQYVHAFPNFGPERAGAPVTSFTRICPEKFTEKTEVYYPDAVCVIDPSLLGSVNVASGLKPGGTIICNYPGDMDSLKSYFEGVDAKIYKVDGTKIAMEELGVNKPNMVMLGALLKVVPLVKLENLISVTRGKFNEAVGEKNAKAMQRAYDEVE